jgi:hypothetical protein
LGRFSCRRMGGRACSVTGSGPPLVAPSLVSSRPRPLNLEMFLCPRRPKPQCLPGDQSRARKCFMGRSRPTLALQAANPLLLSLMPSYGRRYACITLAAVTRNGFSSCYTGASPQYDLHDSPSLRIFLFFFYCFSI